MCTDLLQCTKSCVGANPSSLDPLAVRCQGRNLSGPGYKSWRRGGRLKGSGKERDPGSQESKVQKLARSHPG